MVITNLGDTNMLRQNNCLTTTTTNATFTLPSMLDDDSEFRQFLFWLCGFTDATEAPDAEHWKKLQEKVKEIAALYAAARRTKLRDNMGSQPYQPDLWPSPTGTPVPALWPSTTDISVWPKASTTTSAWRSAVSGATSTGK